MPPTKRQRSTSPLRGGHSNKKTTPSSRASTPNSAAKKRSNKDWVQWKKQQKHDYNTHQFLDASATVQAGLFGARRLPEIKSLWRQMVQGELDTVRERGDRPNDANGERIDQASIRRAGESGGGKISSRHLRRRTNSHKRRRRHRFPRGKDGSGGGDTGVTEDEEGSNNAMVANEMSDRPGTSDDSGKKSKQKQNPCRRARRKPALMKISHSHWWQPQRSTQTVQTQLSTQINEEKFPHSWIPTHLWHAKRFHVSPPLFSWAIPLIHSNRGSRASLRLASSETFPKCTIQDGTWEVNGCAIRLEVTKEATSSQESMRTLISILQKLCGSEAPFLNEESILTGQGAGEGLVHEIDACPLQPIGPATFFFGCSSYDDGPESAHVSILIHPAIHKRVVSLLRTILPTDTDTNGKVTLSTVSLSLLRIRGRASTSTLNKVLGIAENSGSLGDRVNHGTLIEGGAHPESDFKSISNTITGQSSILLKSHQPNQNYQHLPHNLSSSGWDILCHPSVSSSLFQAFINNGGACAIGLAEDARAHLEAYPPLPMFPRDYPDTEEGKSYWEGGTSLALANKKHGECGEEQSLATWKDWAVVRTCVEGSWGRINTPLKRTIRHWKQHDDKEKGKSREENKSKSHESPMLETSNLSEKSQLFGRDTSLIHWTSLISPDEESTIVVRGSFGVPFLQLLHGCGRLHSQPGSDATENTRHRRPRRKVRPPNLSVHASPLSRQESQAHSNMCQQLSSSLSLPALLRCELYCEGKGAFNIGDLIFPLDLQDSDDISEGSELDDGASNADEKSQSLPLGVVVAGGFSPSRGRYHGIGFVGAAKLMDALDGTVHGMGMATPQSNGQKKMALKVMLVRDVSCAGCRRYALLSILL
mmetsp:Transcript_16451/g.35551  ORF Transcript_16451/g.35551 Transcript_16451/m.35551 type:complete len:875 (-) Transcript_16451:39-2663(-)|eukprot:CAMPEP_0172314956 /NCGR_PEP_ID=MMETSP1058-20130122/23651_1 /TAXON_ID=83371 /ORGANISM="Detonula confervacea, Strain CCMP 353" /LENGTH=874 /DNA_ID=CAMNT_0013028917 /DNA_START=120 /DNA_END=2744 /DNA_ORIENTATION=-